MNNPNNSRQDQTKTGVTATLGDGTDNGDANTVTQSLKLSGQLCMPRQVKIFIEKHCYYRFCVLGLQSTDGGGFSFCRQRFELYLWHW